MGRKKPDPQPQPYRPGKQPGVYGPSHDLLGKPIRPDAPILPRGGMPLGRPTPPKKKKEDFLSGLTHEPGTKSLLKGMLKFLK